LAVAALGGEGRMSEKQQITLTVRDDAATNGKWFSAYASDTVLHMFGTRIVESIMRNLSERVEREWMDRHSQEVLESIDPTAVSRAVKLAIETRIATTILGGRA
jgi:hypothetical protein